MLKRIALHIGAEKTGTTSIQEFMAVNRDALLREGRYYPRAPGQKNHVRLTIASAGEGSQLVRRALAVAGDTGLEELRARTRRELHEDVAASGASSIILSNEHLHSHLRTAEEVRRLQALLPAAESVSVILYVRRQDRAAVSLHSQALKAGGGQEGFQFPALRAGSVPYRYDYLAAYRLWASVFGNDAIHIRVFDKKRMAGGDLLRDFCEAAAIPWSDDHAVPDARNTSLDVNGEYVFREFNKLRQEGNALSPHAQAYVKSVLVKLFSDGDKPRPARSEAQAFFAHFSQANEELRRLAFGTSGEPLFDADFSDYPEEAASPEAVVDHTLVCQTLLKALLEEAGARESARRAARRGDALLGLKRALTGR